MRIPRIALAVAVAVGLAATQVKADDAPKEPSAGTKLDTITEHRNELGQTVYSIRASHFDISRPLIELASQAAPEQSSALERLSDPDYRAEENESELYPRVSKRGIMRAGVTDAIVQAVPTASLTSAASSVTPSAPTIGFNFQGAGTGAPLSGPGSPSDANGSVGNNQFVQTVNVGYQVWSLNRATQTATSILGPAAINTLWSGFGGKCETQNSGDPVVLYDKIADRWLISQFTAGSASVYYECVAVSTTANAAGTYARYAFAIPSGVFGDYPHFGVWNDAYYMSAHGKSASQFAAIFAALDRSKMLQANPAATWVVIMDPAEGGHMPADLDGFALPPSKAPGIFLSLHDDGMHIYRMKANFGAPGLTQNTLQAVVPVAPATGACRACIPQPGTSNTLASGSGSAALMFRAAYRNFIDHESIVVSHVVDPSVSGVVSGVRWYDFRISGTPDATCSAYPCIYQQGTIADVPNGRSRFFPTLAMDGAENILVGYSTSGKTDGADNHSSRYTGRAKGDTLGTMTVPETTVVSGTVNNTLTANWGDYFSMSSDPFDDCTFWFVSQYYAVNYFTWSTRIASAAFPVGSGPGQCAPTTCPSITSRPGTLPVIGTATTPADNQIAVTWTGISPQPGAYAVERAEGACNAEGLYRPLTAVGGATTSYADTTVQGGVTYAYRVRGATDAGGRCQSLLSSLCVNATATGTCDLTPTFGGATSAVGSAQSNCGVTIGWTAGASKCPLAPSVRYNVYRGTAPYFVPGAANRIATCVAGPSSYVDRNNLQSGVTYYYVVRAEDTTTGHAGACGGNEDGNSVRVWATPYGSGVQASPGTFTDAGGDGSQLLTFGTTFSYGGAPSTGSPGWRIVRTADDAGANHTPGGAYAYRNTGPSANNGYSPFACAQLETPPLTIGATSVNLRYWERHQLDYGSDAVAVEYSVNGGAWTGVPAPSNNVGDGCDASDATASWEPLSCVLEYACGIPTTEDVFTGPLGSGTSCADFTTSPAIGPYAHRCHPLTGLTPNDTIRFRWLFSSGDAPNYAGFYLDDVAVTNIALPNACEPDTCAGQSNGASCSDGDACTVGDVCGNGVCAAGSPVGPADTTNLTAGADKATYSWSAVPSATRYDVVRGSLGSFPVGPGGGDEVCFDDLPTPTLVDGTTPAPGTGFWYLSRGENACNGSYGLRSNGTVRATSTCP